MNSVNQLRPGDAGFMNISGAAGGLIWLGQKIVDATTPEESKYKHVVIVTEAATETRGPLIVQAMPSGAEEIEFRPARWSSDVVFVRPRYAPHGMEMAERVAVAARKYIDVPYSWLDYVAIAGLHIGVKNGLIRRRVTSSKRMICSQLADQAMTDAGWHVFDDERLPQDVVPSALYRQLMKMPGQYIVGGTNVWRPTMGS